MPKISMTLADFLPEANQALMAPYRGHELELGVRYAQSNPGSDPEAEAYFEAVVRSTHVAYVRRLLDELMGSTDAPEVLFERLEPDLSDLPDEEVEIAIADYRAAWETACKLVLNPDVNWSAMGLPAYDRWTQMGQVTAALVSTSAPVAQEA